MEKHRLDFANEVEGIISDLRLVWWLALSDQPNLAFQKLTGLGLKVENLRFLIKDWPE